ncbi:MAG TPA: GNAT family N-acetyltransferase [Ktedonobacterales bacterium]
MRVNDGDVAAGAASAGAMQALTRRVIAQRAERYPDAGPDLRRAATARFRREPQRLLVAYAHVLPGRASEAISAVQSFARPRGMQVLWNVLPQLEGETELPGALAATGFTRTEHLLLMGHMGEVKGPRNPAVSVERITSWDEMLAYERGSRIAFFNDSFPAAEVVRMRATDRWHAQQVRWCDYYSARVNGEIVGGCYFTCYEDVPTIMGVYTLPALRGRGVATTMLATVLSGLHAQRHTATCLFVRHDNPAQSVYRTLGFVPLCDEDTWLWDPWESGDVTLTW